MRILTSSGNYFKFDDLESNVIDIRSIGHSISKLCRFNGHTKRHYSVAQHSVITSHLVPKEHAFKALMHDSHEAFSGDITRPILMMFPELQAFEKRIQKFVLSRFGIDDLPDCVHHADMVALATEKRDVCVNPLDDSYEWTSIAGIEPMKDIIVPWEAPDAYIKFLHRFKQLGGQL